MARYDLSEAEWRVMEPPLPPGGRGKARVDDRRVVNGIFNVLRTGSPWRDLPERYGPYTTVYNRFNRWAKRSMAGDVRGAGGALAALAAADRQLDRARAPARRRG